MNGDGRRGFEVEDGSGSRIEGCLVYELVEAGNQCFKEGRLVLQDALFGQH